MQSIQSLIDQAAGEREEKEIKSWHCSALGMCLCGVYLERIGVPAIEELDARTKRVFQCGRLFEEYVINQIKKTDTVFEEQVRVENKELGISGYADLVITNEDGSKEVVEVKSQHSRSFWYMIKKGEGAYKHHKMQILLYMMTLGINNGKLIYCSKDDLCIEEFPIYLDREVELCKEVMERLKILNTALDTKTIPQVDENNPLNKYCRYHDYCIGKLPLPITKKI